MKKIRVLIVDDSPTMRGLIKAVLAKCPEIDVVGTAADPYEARSAIKELLPDVITLDVEMPRMSGIEFLKKIMQLRPMPVIMVSTLTHAGTATAIEALTLGAVDCVGKPASGALHGAFCDLPDKIRAAANAPLSALHSKTARGAASRPFVPNDRVVFIGASTGGVQAISDVLRTYPANCPPTVIVQHMPPGFTKSFAARLSDSCAPTVVEASNEDILKPGHVYIASGGDLHLEVCGRSTLYCKTVTGPPVSGHQPSVDVLFRSAATLKSRAIGVILTGMGQDGADGLRLMRESGATTIGQDQASSVVYGMPRIAFEQGSVEQQLPLSRISDQIMALCQ